MRTALEMLDRMEALCRRMAARMENVAFNTTDYLEAREIVAQLPDPDEQIARNVLADWYANKGYDTAARQIRQGYDVEGIMADEIAASIKNGAEYVRAGRAAK